jgi:hypothetical protein
LLSVGTKVWQLFVWFISPERCKSEKILHITVKLCGVIFNLYYSFQGHHG